MVDKKIKDDEETNKTKKKRKSAASNQPTLGKFLKTETIPVASRHVSNIFRGVGLKYIRNIKLTNPKKPGTFLHLRPILKTPEKEFCRYHENSSEAPGVEKYRFLVEKRSM